MLHYFAPLIKKSRFSCVVLLWRSPQEHRFYPACFLWKSTGRKSLTTPSLMMQVYCSPSRCYDSVISCLSPATDTAVWNSKLYCGSFKTRSASAAQSEHPTKSSAAPFCSCMEVHLSQPRKVAALGRGSTPYSKSAHETCKNQDCRMVCLRSMGQIT